MLQKSDWFSLDGSVKSVDIRVVFSHQTHACLVKVWSVKLNNLNDWTKTTNFSNNTSSWLLFVDVSPLVLSTPWWTCCLRWWWASRTLSAASSPTTTGRRWLSARRGWWCSCATRGSWRRWTSVDRATPTASRLKSLSTGECCVQTGNALILQCEFHAAASRHPHKWHRTTKTNAASHENHGSLIRSGYKLSRGRGWLIGSH